jgi:hypothetical protein
MPYRLPLASHDVEACTAPMARWSTVGDLVAALAESGPPARRLPS